MANHLSIYKVYLYKGIEVAVINQDGERVALITRHGAAIYATASELTETDKTR